jgi:hypothetical protein
MTTNNLRETKAMDTPTSTNLIEQKQPNTAINFDNLTSRMDHAEPGLNPNNNL